MQMPRVIKRLLGALLLFLTAALGLAASAVPAAAQDQRSPTPAVLTQVLLISETPSESKFRLSFSPRANTYGPVGNEPARPALGLALTTRGNSAVTQTVAQSRSRVTSTSDTLHEGRPWSRTAACTSVPISRRSSAPTRSVRLKSREGMG